MGEKTGNEKGRSGKVSGIPPLAKMKGIHTKQGVLLPNDFNEA